MAWVFLIGQAQSLPLTVQGRLLVDSSLDGRPYLPSIAYFNPFGFPLKIEYKTLLLKQHMLRTKDLETST